VESEFSIVTQAMVDYYRCLALRSNYWHRKYYNKLADGMQKAVRREQQQPEQQPVIITRKAA